MANEKIGLNCLSSHVVGVVVGLVAVMYFAVLYNKTHRFSYGRLCYALVLGTILFGPFVYFGANKSLDKDSWTWREWCGIAVYSFVGGGCLCVIFGLGLGCSTNRGATSEFAARFLKCRLRDERGNASAPRLRD
jgi:drug/metabolite transporter (DMT)-like permease